MRRRDRSRNRGPTLASGHSLLPPPVNVNVNATRAWQLAPEDDKFSFLVLVLEITIAHCNVIGREGAAVDVPWKEEGEAPPSLDGRRAQKLLGR